MSNEADESEAGSPVRVAERFSEARAAPASPGPWIRREWDHTLKQKFVYFPQEIGVAVSWL
jgi:hypothetical protein